MHKEFEVNKLSNDGLKVMNDIAVLFDNLLNELLCMQVDDSREMRDEYREN